MPKINTLTNEDIEKAVTRLSTFFKGPVVKEANGFRGALDDMLCVVNAWRRTRELPPTLAGISVRLEERAAKIRESAGREREDGEAKTMARKLDHAAAVLTAGDDVDLLMPDAAWRKAVDWYLTHPCPKADGDMKPGDPMFRCGCTGYDLSYEFHPSSIGNMVNARCGHCGEKLEDINDDAANF